MGGEWFPKARGENVASKKHWRKRARRRAHHIEQLERALQDAEAEASEAKILNCRLRLEALERDVGLPSPPAAAAVAQIGSAP